MGTDTQTPSNTGEIMEETVKRDALGRILAGSKLNPAGKPKGAIHSRTLFENFLEEKYRMAVKKKAWKKQRRHNLETGKMEEIESLEETDEIEMIETEYTRFEMLCATMFERALKDGKIEGMYMLDQKIGKAVQQMMIQTGNTQRGFELPPDEEAKVEEKFSLNDKVQEIVAPIIESLKQDAISDTSFSLTEENTTDNNGGPATVEGDASPSTDQSNQA